MSVLLVYWVCFFTILSFIIFMVNFDIMITKAKKEIDLLIELGYRISIIAKYLIFYFTLFTLVVAAFVFVSLNIATNYINALVDNKGINIEAGLNGWVLVVGIAFIVLSLAVNIFSVFRLLEKGS